MEAYLAWGRNEGKYVDQHYRQYVAHVKAKIHATPIVEVTPGLLSALKGELVKAPIKTAKPQKGDKAKPAKLLAGSTVNVEEPIFRGKALRENPGAILTINLPCFD
ncbi:MAG: hypothetical protein LBP61_08290 [Desulfovibrio sp.]|nr:hypothetical protein [Desulfovibrio sp.]